MLHSMLIVEHISYLLMTIVFEFVVQIRKNYDPTGTNKAVSFVNTTFLRIDKALTKRTVNLSLFSCLGRQMIENVCLPNRV